VTARGWLREAACADRLDLPWITDFLEVGDGDREAMGAVCAGCPVLAVCASQADALEVDGGFWAGRHRDAPTAPAELLPVWVVWVPHTSRRRSAIPAGAGGRWVQAALTWPGVA